jgi:predicted HicB family RNase H-like nuclease
VPKKSVQKSAQIRVRVAPKQKAEFAREAQRRGLSLSSWLVSLACEAIAKKESP